MEKTWSVCLNNESCIFDSADGFKTLEEALNWATGRGSKYNVQVEGPDNLFLHMSYSKRRGGFSFESGYCMWTFISDVHKFCQEYDEQK
jgi:hypothetical protein